MPTLFLPENTPVLSPEEIRAIEVLHEATLQDLIKTKNYVILQLLEECNKLLREQYFDSQFQT